MPADVTTTFDAADHRWMARALRLAARGRWTTRANPQVGCVLVRDGALVAEGWHVRPGGPHAEAHALARAGDAARGATAYVTLEPCAHHGRTPPCADALVAAGVARVVVANEDPNPQVGGRGLARLREAGIRCETGLLAGPAARLNRAFLAAQRTGRPWLRVKLAASADGRTALADGTSAWITGPAARDDVQRLRARACAILTGADTVLADDPSLTVRIGSDGRANDERDTDLAQPLRVIIDGRARVGADARTLACPGESLVCVTTGADPQRMAALRDAGAEVRAFESIDGRVPLAAALTDLVGRGINEVHSECGPALAGALVDAGLVDELVVYTAPSLLGDGARPLLALPAPATMSARRTLRIGETRRIGDDLRVTWVPEPPPGTA